MAASNGATKEARYGPIWVPKAPYVVLSGRGHACRPDTRTGECPSTRGNFWRRQSAVGHRPEWVKKPPPTDPVGW